MISLCMIVAEQDAKQLRTAINSAKEVATQIIVVNQGDSPKIKKTVQGIRKNAMVIPTTLKGNADPDREYAARFADQEYVLFLDADEVVSKTLANWMKKYLSSMVKEFDVFWIPFKNTVDGVDIEDILGKDYHPRLHKRGSVIWKPTLHTSPDVKSSNIYFLDDKYCIEHIRSSEQIVESHKKRHHMLDPRSGNMEMGFLQRLSQKLSKDLVTPVFGEKKVFRSV